MNYSINYQTAVKSSLILLIVIGLAITFTALFTAEDQHATVSPQVEIVNITHYIDQQKQINIEDLLINDSIISQATTNPTSFGHNPHTIWLKIIVSNPLNHAYSWVLNTTNNYLLSASIYERITSNNKPAYELIYNHGNPRVQNLPYFTPSLASNISFKANETKTLYIQYHSLMSTHLHINFDTMDNAVKSNFQDKAALEIEVAILFTLIFINFLFYFSLRKIQYLYYCLQELFIIFLFLVNAGYGLQFIHPDNANYIPISTAIFTLLTTAASMMFINAFLDIKSLSAKFSRVPFIYVSLCFIFIALSMIPFTQTVMLQHIIPPFIFSSIVFSFILGCVAVYNKKYYAIPFCLAWIALVFFISITMVSVIDIYHIESTNHFYPTYIGYLIEGALLSLAMGLQISDLRKQNKSWTQKLINIYKERSVEAQELQQAFKEKRSAIKEKLKKSNHLASASHDINHNLFFN